MDGNGRWAQQRGLPRTMGHKVGVDSVQEIVRESGALGIKYLTLYAFSTENWKRPAQEVGALMGLLKSYLQSELAALVKNNVSLRCIGEKERIPAEVRGVLDRVILETAGNTGLILTLALSYGGRNEIIRAVRSLARECAAGNLQWTDITEETLTAHLDTGDQPDPDLLIRTGGESRLSNFLLWQASYAEIYISDVLWPDFRKAELSKAIQNYQRRQRRFGKTDAQLQAHPGTD